MSGQMVHWTDLNQPYGLPMVNFVHVGWLLFGLAFVQVCLPFLKSYRDYLNSNNDLKGELVQFALKLFTPAFAVLSASLFLLAFRKVSRGLFPFW